MRSFITILLFSLAVSGQSITFEYELNSESDTLLLLKSIDGAITVRGSAQKNIKIVQRISSNFDIESLNKGNLKSVNQIVEFNEQPGISITIDRSYDITVPKNMNIRFDLLGGKIDVTDIHGSLKLVKLSGEITLNEIEGKVHVTTGNGDLTINNVKGDILGSALNGNIFTGNTQGKLHLETGSGDLSIIEHSGNLMMKTYVGNCIIQNTIGDSIHALTRGGDIAIHSLSSNDGIFNTMAGDILLENVDGNISTETYGGIISGSNWTGDFTLQNYSGGLSLDNIHGNLKINSFYGNVRIRRYFPDESIGDSSIIKIVSGNLNMSYTGDHVGLDVKTQGGAITSNILKMVGKLPYIGVYHPENEIHTISVTLLNGNIIINKGIVND